jgi:hypothetical protein
MISRGETQQIDSTIFRSIAIEAVSIGAGYGIRVPEILFRGYSALGNTSPTGS